MPLPLLALAAAPAIAKGLLGAYQLTQHVNRTDTTTPAEREQLALARQSAAAQLPGLGQYQARLAQAQNATVQNAALGSGGASDFLAANAAADRVRQNGEQQLVAQGQQYHDQATRQLGATLAAYGRHQQADTDRATQANAQLKGAALQNLSGALSDGASVAAYGASRAAGASDYGLGDTRIQANPALQASPYQVGDYPYRRRSGPYAGYLG